MRFYVPEWDDCVDAQYNFIHDELSELDRSKRERDYIWDIFDYESTPVDGVLISREQVESSAKRSERLRKYGVYDDPKLSIPSWLPTISDCGAWGYKWLPFPPYDNHEMLKFYETLDVDVGVSIDHLVLGSGKDMGRLYINKRAFGDGFTADDLPSTLSKHVEIKSEEWPHQWPEYVEEYEPSIYDVGDYDYFTADDFARSVPEILLRLEDDPRAVYRGDDKQFRYNLTLENAREMRALYDDGEWSFRLMGAFQGWSPQTYADAVSDLLKIGYRYVGIGGVAGSPESSVKDIVREVGGVVKEFERSNATRVDTHVFGFAKSGAFDTVGRSGMTSFDSASMLRSAWTGGKNYHIDTANTDVQYDAIRVRYGSPHDSLEQKIETALRGQELLAALRAYDERTPISTAIESWYTDAKAALENLEPFLRTHRHDDRYDDGRIREITDEFRSHYQYGPQLKASFGKGFRKCIVKLLREDDPNDTLSFEQYKNLIDIATKQIEKLPHTLHRVRSREGGSDEGSTFEQIWVVVKDYATWIGDGRYLDAYEKTLRLRPWEDCDCPVCKPTDRYGIEVIIFRGNNRNRRRGFHNTRRFYDRFERDLPKTLVAVPATNGFADADTVQSYLESEYGEFWSAVHDLPVAEVGVASSAGFHEWWDTPPSVSSVTLSEVGKRFARVCQRYQRLVLYSPNEGIDQSGFGTARESGCKVEEFSDPQELRRAVLRHLGYSSEEDFLPTTTVQNGLDQY